GWSNGDVNRLRDVLQSGYDNVYAVLKAKPGTIREPDVNRVPIFPYYVVFTGNVREVAVPVGIGIGMSVDGGVGGQAIDCPAPLAMDHVLNRLSAYDILIPPRFGPPSTGIRPLDATLRAVFSHEPSSISYLIEGAKTPCNAQSQFLPCPAGAA